MVKSVDYYEVLEIDPSASEKEVKDAFRRLTKLYHPDKHSNSKQSHNKYMKIVEAFNVLSNMNDRVQYDLERRTKTSQGKPFKQGAPFSSQGAPFKSKSYNRNSNKNDYTSIFRYTPEQNADYLYDVGLSYLNAQFYDKSINYLDLAIGQYPQKSVYYLRKGEVLMKLHKNKEALACFEKCLLIDPGNIGAIKNRNQILNLIKSRVY
jgi:curved DNA-binding protein CbpA